MTTPTNGRPTTRPHNPPPWETTPPTPEQERAWHAEAVAAAAAEAKRQRRRGWPVIGALLRARDDRALQQHRAAIAAAVNPDRLYSNVRDTPPPEAIGPASTEPEFDDPELEFDEYFGHVGDSGVFADPPAAATRRYVLDAYAAQTSNRPSSADDFHPDHAQFLAEQRRYDQLVDAQFDLDDHRARRVVDELNTWARRHDLHIYATRGEHIEGELTVRAHTPVEREAAEWAVDQIRRHIAPDQVDDAEARGNTRYSPDAEAVDRLARQDALEEAQRRHDPIAQRAWSATLTGAAFDRIQPSNPQPGLQIEQIEELPVPDQAPAVRVQEFADDFLHAHRRGDHDAAAEIRSRLTPDRMDRLIGGYPGAWTGSTPAEGQPWTWTERVNHLGDSGEFADPAPQATRDYLRQAHADLLAGRPSAAAPDHPDHDHYLLRQRHYRDVRETQDHRDAQRANIFLAEIRSWADRHELDVDAAPGILDGTIELSAGSAAGRDAARHAMIDLRKRFAPDHVTFATAVGDTRFTPEADQLRRAQRLDTLDQATREGDTRTIRAVRASLSRDHLDPDACQPGEADPTPRPRPATYTPAKAAQAVHTEPVDEPEPKPGTDPAPVYVTGSRARESSTLYVSASPEVLDDPHMIGRGADPAIEIHDRSQAQAEDQRLQLDRDEPQTPRGQAEPESTRPPTESTPPPVYKHEAAANRTVDNHDAADDISPDVRQLQTVVDQHVARHDRETPAADESPPHPPDIGREL